MKTKRTPQSGNKPRNSFVETARELGLDNEESAVAFERAFGKIAPPKRPGDVAPPKLKDEPKRRKQG